MKGGSQLRLVPIILILAATMSVGQSSFPVNLEIFRKSIVFLYASDALGNVNTSLSLATGFLVGVPLRSAPGKVHVYLVTGRHVVDPAWAYCQQQTNPVRIFLRLNKKNFDPTSDQSGVDYLPLDLVREGLQQTVFTHSDPSVDAAVIRIPGSLQNQIKAFDLASIDLENFATTDELSHLDAGVEIVSAGLLPAFPGVQRNYPVFKFGRVSAKPDEKVQVPCAPGHPPNSLRIWLIAMNMVGGNSGSPIVTVPGLFSGERAQLVGLQSVSFEGTDVAGMTSSQYVFEIIEKMGIADHDLYRGPPRK